MIMFIFKKFNIQIAQAVAGATLFVGSAAAQLSIDSGNAPAPAMKVPDVSQGDLVTSTPAQPTENPGAGDKGLPELKTDGYWVQDAPLNEIFQYLARRAGQQYFFNNRLTGPDYNVTGHLHLRDIPRQMEELAVAYGLTTYIKGDTIYLMTEEQIARLPVERAYIPMQYLRGADFEKIKLFLAPMLTPGTGVVQYETKTNFLLIVDTAPRIEQIKEALQEIDKAKRQIVINVRIMRVNNVNRNRIGVDWSSVLGDNGLPINVTQSLNSVFNLPNASTATKVITSTVGNNLGITTNKVNGRATTAVIPGGSFTGTATDNSTVTSNNVSTNNQSTASTVNKAYTDGSGLVFSALQLNGVLRALYAGNLASQEASPTVITEDNEQGLITVTDRYPIITSTITDSQSGTQNVTDTVRYRIDESDTTVTEDPTKSREIGVTLTVTPTILPDDTIRMQLTPRVSKIIEFIPSVSGNSYPRVSESSIHAISRIPNGHSLVIGGFYEQTQDNVDNKVPLFGDVPVLKFFFQSKDHQKAQNSLIFIVTPNAYDADASDSLAKINDTMYAKHKLPGDFDQPDFEKPGANQKANLKQTVHNWFHKPKDEPQYNPLLPPYEDQIIPSKVPNPNTTLPRNAPNTTPQIKSVTPAPRRN
jgi:type II secretory pathway component GspD/PulD (secretin)